MLNSTSDVSCMQANTPRRFSEYLKEFKTDSLLKMCKKFRNEFFIVTPGSKDTAYSIIMP